MFENIYDNKKVLITGNTGFKGSWLSIWLLNLGAEVYGLSKDIPSTPSMFKVLKLEDKIKHYEQDILDLEKVKKIINEIKPDFIFHLAAQSLVSVSYSDPVNTISTNLMGTTNILEALREYNKTCIAVIITSDKCYDNVEWLWGYKETDRLGGKDVYSGSKGAAEIIFNSYYHSFFNQDDSLIKLVTVRAGNVIGGGDWARERIVPDCFRAWSNNDTVEIRSPKATRPWQHVLEPLSGYLNLAQILHSTNSFNGESFNFGPLSKYSQTVKELLKDLSQTWNIDSGKAFKITENIKFHEAGLLKLNCDKSLFSLKWLPTLSYKELIDFTGSWYFNYYRDNKNMFDYTIEQINEYERLAKINKRLWTK